MAIIERTNESLQDMGTILRATAPVLYGYYRTLLEQGFDEETAIKLVRDVQDAILDPLYHV